MTSSIFLLPARAETMVSRNRPRQTRRQTPSNFFEFQSELGGNMEQAGQYTLCDSRLSDKLTAIGRTLWYIAERVLLILSILGFTYSIIAAEVALAKYEQISSMATR
jgi:hypothetical protein